MFTFSVRLQSSPGGQSLWEQGWVPLCTAAREGGLYHIQEPGTFNHMYSMPDLLSHIDWTWCNFNDTFKVQSHYLSCSDIWSTTPTEVAIKSSSLLLVSAPNSCEEGGGHILSSFEIPDIIDFYWFRWKFTNGKCGHTFNLTMGPTNLCN